MKIDGSTRISKIIKHNDRAIEAIVSVSGHFDKLRNPVLRRILAPRVSLSDAARIGNVPVDRLLDALEDIGFEIDRGNIQPQTKTVDRDPRILQALDAGKIESLDVRPILSGGTDPFEHIMDRFVNLPMSYVLKVINTFEPTPLIGIMKDRGAVTMIEKAGEVVNSYFLKVSGEFVGSGANENKQEIGQEDMERLLAGFGNRVHKLDVRFLEMPEPMISILQSSESLEEGEALFVHHKKVPQYLFPEIEARQLRIYVQPVDESNVKLLIHRK